jgi:hypothetical protein
MPGTRLCRHCGSPHTCHGYRGLCHICWRKPQIRSQYGPTLRYKEAARVPDKLPEPTTAYPGSPEKMAVLQHRIEAGELIHHPEDLAIDMEGNLVPRHEVFPDLTFNPKPATVGV